MFKKFSFLFLLIPLVAVMPFTALAHAAQTDGTITGMLHVDSNDAPYVNAPSTITIKLTDSANKFVPADCDCKVSIKDPGGIVTPNIHTVLKLDSVVSPYIFPTVGTYTIMLDGAPHVAGKFQPFHLSYETTVIAAPVETPKKQFPLRDLVYFSIVGIGLLAGFYNVLSGNKKKMI